MPPTIKDLDTAAASQENGRSGSTLASSGDSAARPQPVALEVPITVNGARTIEGSDKREPFSESTKTVMVHGSGAVIRLNSSMAPGQLLFLTNERTKKEVVCQVVKSKNHRNVSGYLELEFTEPAVGFWGMRFPGDRIGPAPQATPAATRPAAADHGALAETRPAAQKTEPPAAHVSSYVPVKPSAPAPVSSNPAPSIVPAPIDSAALLGAPKPKANSGVPAAPVVSSLDADEPLLEPWLRKREPAPRPPLAPPRAAAPEARAKSEEPEANLSTPVRNFELTRPSDKPASLFAPSESPANPLNVGLSSIAPFFEVKPAPTENAPAPVHATEPAPVADDSEAEELKRQTARLQEELSKMQIAESTASEPVEPGAETTSFPLSEHTISTLKTELKCELLTEAVHDSAVRLVEHAEPPEASVLAETRKLEPLKVEPPAAVPTLEFLEQEEMKIPAWLAPLARNASAPSSTEELVLREKAKRLAERPRLDNPLQELMAPLAAPVEETQAAESRVPQFGGALPFDEGARARKERAPRKSGKGLPFAALAAGILLLAAGGWWYRNRHSAGVHAGAGAVSRPNQDLPTSTVQESVIGTALGGRTNSGAADSQARTAADHSNEPAHSVGDLSSSAPAGPAVVAGNPQVIANSSNAGNAVAIVGSTAPDAEPVQEKKPVLGEVHLAAPKVSQKRTVQGAEPDEAILNQDQPESSADSLGPGLGMGGNQPAAPASTVAVGGDVTQAKLISSVPPVYPQAAKKQHISGGVTIDALIDEGGRVTTMKVISGPTLLQQAAMEALKQWKYQPAMLDRKAVPMHLTVTLQFKLQQ